MIVVSSRFLKSLHVALVCFLSLWMLVACGRTRTIQEPPGPGSLPPVVDGTKAPFVPIPRTVPPRSISQIHDRLFQKAQKHFQAEEFPKAIRELKRLLGLNPDANLERDGRWWLGQSYDQVQDWESARREYHMLASAPAGQRYQSDSTQRLKEIKGILEFQELAP